VQGLATPYQLSCDENNADNSAFVQATILAPNGAVSVYSPLVISQGTTPAAAPVRPRIQAGSVVGIWFGYNADDLHLVGPGAAACVNGSGGQDFGQFAACNATRFFTAANAAIRRGTLRVPQLGQDNIGALCPTVSHFGIVDADPADNVQTTYLATADGKTAQNTAANRAALAGATVLGNPSDDGLLTELVDPAIGCRPWTAPNLADRGARVASLALSAIQGRQMQPAPIANVQTADPMAGTQPRAVLYRSLVNQAQNVPFTGQYYCRGLVRTGSPWLKAHQAMLAAAAGPGGAGTLWDFLLTRYQETYQGQDCQNITGQASPL